MKTKAAILTELNSPLEIMDLEIPKLSVGHVLVEVHTTGICGSQILEIQGYKNNTKFLPHMMGHEGGGIVIDVDSSVSKVKSGDRVVIHWRKSSGIEANFVKYGNIGSGKAVTFAEKVIVSENRITKVPNDMKFDLCALCGCCLTTVLYYYISYSQLKT